MALFRNRLNVLNGGSDIGDFEHLDAQTNLTATANGEVAELDASGGGGGDHTTVGGTTTISKLADETVSSSTAYQSDDELLITLTTGRTYYIEMHLNFTESGGGMKFAMAGTATASSDLSFIDILLSSSASSGGSSTLTLTDSTLVSFATGQNPVHIHTYGEYACNGTGTLIVRWAQNSSSGSATALKQGSTLKVTRTA